MRATGLQGDASAEIIEIIDDGTDIFSGRAISNVMYDSGGPGWAGPVAVGVLVAIIGWGVATSASGSGTATVALPSASSAALPATTLHPPPTADPTPLVPYYAADPPLGMTPQNARIEQPQDNYYGPSTYQLWAKPGPTANSGAWFSVESSSGSGPGTFAFDAYRVQAGTLSLAISRTSGGHSSVQFSPAGRDTVTMMSFGLGDQDIVRIAQDIRVVRNLVQFSDRSVIEGYDLVSTVQPRAAVQGVPVESLYYADENDPTLAFSITVSQRNPTTPGGSGEDRQTALRFMLVNTTPFYMGDSLAIAGDVLGQTNFSLATWTVGDHIVTVTGSMPARQVAAIARTVHEISAEEWSNVQLQANAQGAAGNFGNYVQSPPVPVSVGTDSNGQQWTIEVATATFEDKHQLVWQWDDAGFGSPAGAKGKITTVVDDKRTYVFAELPRSPASTSQLQILRDGLDPILVPFADPDPELDRTVAAYAFSEPVAFTAQIIGTDDAVLANWPQA